MSNDPTKRPPSNNHRYQFTIATLLLIAVPISILAGTWAGLIDFDAPRPLRAFHLLIAVAAPMGLLIVLSLIRALIHSNRGPRR